MHDDVFHQSSYYGHMQTRLHLARSLQLLLSMMADVASAVPDQFRKSYLSRLTRTRRALALRRPRFKLLPTPGPIIGRAAKSTVFPVHWFRTDLLPNTVVQTVVQSYHMIYASILISILDRSQYYPSIPQHTHTQIAYNCFKWGTYNVANL